MPVVTAGIAVGPLSMSPSPDPRQVWQRYGGVTIGGGARLPRGAHRRWRGIGVCAGPCLRRRWQRRRYPPTPHAVTQCSVATRLQKKGRVQRRFGATHDGARPPQAYTPNHPHTNPVAPTHTIHPCTAKTLGERRSLPLAPSPFSSRDASGGGVADNRGGGGGSRVQRVACPTLTCARRCVWYQPSASQESRGWQAQLMGSE